MTTSCDRHTQRADITITDVRAAQARLARSDRPDPTLDEVAGALRCETGALLGILAATSGARVAAAGGD